MKSARYNVFAGFMGFYVVLWAVLQQFRVFDILSDKGRRIRNSIS